MATGYRVSEAPPTKDTFTPFLQQIFAQNLASEQAEDRTLASEKRLAQRQEESSRRKIANADINRAILNSRAELLSLTDESKREAYANRMQGELKNRFTQKQLARAFGLRPDQQGGVEAAINYKLLKAPPAYKELQQASDYKQWKKSAAVREKKFQTNLVNAEKELEYKKELRDMVTKPGWLKQLPKARLAQLQAMAAKHGQLDQLTKLRKEVATNQSIMAAVAKSTKETMLASERLGALYMKEAKDTLTALRKPGQSPLERTTSTQHLFETMLRLEHHEFRKHRKAIADGEIHKDTPYLRKNFGKIFDHLYIADPQKTQGRGRLDYKWVPKTRRILPPGESGYITRQEYIERLGSAYEPASQFLQKHPHLIEGQWAKTQPAPANASGTSGASSASGTGAVPAQPIVQPPAKEDLAEYPEEVVLPKPAAPNQLGLDTAGEQKILNTLRKATTTPAVTGAVTAPPAAPAPPPGSAPSMPTPNIREQTKNFLQIADVMEATSKERGGTVSAEEFMAILKKSNVKFKEMWNASQDNADTRRRLNRLFIDYNIPQLEDRLTAEKEGGMWIGSM